MKRKTDRNVADANLVLRVNELFHSVQAEGRNAGRPAVFVRLAGCNLKCRFCDTDHEPYREMTVAEIEDEVDALDPTGRSMVVFTGGEPTLQLNMVRSADGICKGRFRAIETNGIVRAPAWLEWVTVSPKTKLDFAHLARASEVKFVYGTFPEKHIALVGKRMERAGIPCYIQPMADGDGRFDPAEAVAFAKANPYWTVSLQWHKLFNIR